MNRQAVKNATQIAKKQHIILELLILLLGSWQDVQEILRKSFKRPAHVQIRKQPAPKPGRLSSPLL